MGLNSHVWISCAYDQVEKRDSVMCFPTTPCLVVSSPNSEWPQAALKQGLTVSPVAVPFVWGYWNTAVF